MANVKVNFNFRDAKKESPELQNGFYPTKVLFISEGKIYKGEYNGYGRYYEYGIAGSITCFASAKNYNYGARECTHWCYNSDVDIIFE